MIISVIITLSSLSLFGNFTDKIQMMTTQALSRISRVQKLNYFSKRLKIPSYIPKPREFRTSFTFFFLILQRYVAFSITKISHFSA